MPTNGSISITEPFDYIITYDHDGSNTDDLFTYDISYNSITSNTSSVNITIDSLTDACFNSLTSTQFTNSSKDFKLQQSSGNTTYVYRFYDEDLNMLTTHKITNLCTLEMMNDELILKYIIGHQQNAFI